MKRDNIFKILLMVILITIVLLVCSIRNCFCQVSYITFAPATGQSNTVTYSGSSRAKTATLLLKLTPAAITGLVLQQQKQSDSIRALYTWLLNLELRLKAVEIGPTSVLKPGPGIQLDKISDTITISQKP